LQVADAFATSAEGHVVGKLVISVSNATSFYGERASEALL
jgi:hypothetical protein